MCRILYRLLLSLAGRRGRGLNTDTEFLEQLLATGGESAAVRRPLIRGVRDRFSTERSPLGFN